MVSAIFVDFQFFFFLTRIISSLRGGITSLEGTISSILLSQCI